MMGMRTKVQRLCQAMICLGAIKNDVLELGWNQLLDLRS